MAQSQNLQTSNGTVKLDRELWNEDIKLLSYRSPYGLNGAGPLSAIIATDADFCDVHLSAISLRPCPIDRQSVLGLKLYVG